MIGPGFNRSGHGRSACRAINALTASTFYFAWLRCHCGGWSRRLACMCSNLLQSAQGDQWPFVVAGCHPLLQITLHYITGCHPLLQTVLFESVLVHLEEKRVNASGMDGASCPGPVRKHLCTCIASVGLCGNIFAHALHSGA